MISLDPEDSILKIENVSKMFGGIKAVDDVTLSIRRGSIAA